ncbi:MAG: helix-turn-helix domain-containing protein [Shimia sp.]
MTDQPPAEAPDILDRLATRLKEARGARGLSLAAVAELSGVSRSMVSQIERGESSPTVATLWNLTQALGVDFAGLLEAGPPGIEVMRAGDTPTIEGRGTGCRIRILSAPAKVGSVEVYELHFEAGGRLASSAHAAGARESVTVFEGALTVASGTSGTNLERGDTARYAADVPHTLSAERATRAVLIVESG